MGFDLSGMNPKVNTEPSKLVAEVKKNWSQNYDALNEGEKNQYHEEYTKWQENNPGLYFRANVWGWRPLWAYVYSLCSDVLTEEEYESCSYNDGAEISEVKAYAIAEILFKALKDGDVEAAILLKKAHNDALPDEDCEYCENGIRVMKNEDGTEEEQTCNSCKGSAKVRPFNTHYSTSVDQVKRFAIFAKESGGFTVW